MKLHDHQIYISWSQSLTLDGTGRNVVSSPISESSDLNDDRCRAKFVAWLGLTWVIDKRSISSLFWLIPTPVNISSVCKRTFSSVSVSISFKKQNKVVRVGWEGGREGKRKEERKGGREEGRTDFLLKMTDLGVRFFHRVNVSSRSKEGCLKHAKVNQRKTTSYFRSRACLEVCEIRRNRWN